MTETEIQGQRQKIRDREKGTETERQRQKVRDRIETRTFENRMIYID